MKKSNLKQTPPDKKWKHIDEPLKERLKKNTISNIAYFVLTFPIMFIITPMILKHVGKEAYGVWAIAGTVIAFLDFIGLQTPTALSVFIPKIDPKKNSGQINELLNTLFVFYMAVAVITAAAYFCFKNTLILSIFKVEGSLLNDARFVLTASIVLYLINFVFVAYAYVAVGFNLFYPANMLHIIIGWIRVALMAAVLFLGYGIKGVAVVQAGSILMETLILNVWMKIIYPPLEFNPFLFRFYRLKQLLGLSVKLFVTKMASVVNYNIDKLVLGYLINPVVVAYYQIGAGVAKYVSAVPEMIGALSLVPAASELNSKHQHDKIFSLYSRINKYMFFMGVFITAGILAMGKKFIFLWVGAGYDASYNVMAVLSVAYCISLLGVPAVNILNGIEKVNSTMAVAGFTALLNAVLSFVIAKFYGIAGALAGTLVSMTAGSIAMYILLYLHVKKFINFFDVLIKPAISAVIAAGSVYLLDMALSGGWVVFFGKASVFTAVYILSSFFVVKQFDWYDIDLIKGFIPFIKKKTQ